MYMPPLMPKMSDRLPNVMLPLRPNESAPNVPSSCNSSSAVPDPMDTAALSGDHELAITEIAIHESTHYALTVMAFPGRELGLRVVYDTDVFDADSIETLIERFHRVLAAMTADPAQRLSSIDLLDEAERERLDVAGNRAIVTAPPMACSLPS